MRAPVEFLLRVGVVFCVLSFWLSFCFTLCLCYVPLVPCFFRAVYNILHLPIKKPSPPPNKKKLRPLLQMFLYITCLHKSLPIEMLILSVETPHSLL